MLEQQRIASQRRVEYANVQNTLDREQRQGHRQHWRREHQNHACRVLRPYEKRQPEPDEARCPQLVDGNDEVEAGQNRRKANDEHAGDHRNHVRVRKGGRKRRIEGPAGIDATQEQRGQREKRSEYVQVPARKIESWKREIARAYHQGHEKVSQRRRYRRNEKEPHHDHAVHGEELVVGVGGYQIAGRSGELDADERRSRAADKEEYGDRESIKDRDPLVILRRQPRAQRHAGTEVARRARLRMDHGDAASFAARLLM